MTDATFWSLAGLLGLGAFHGINPGMGWLFAVALGMQESNGRAVWRTLWPVATGHALAIGAVVLLAGAVQAVVPLSVVKMITAASLFAFGAWRLFRHSHPRWAAMRVGFGDLTLWSFLMASAHGAGLMVLPLVLAMSGSSVAMADGGMQMSGHQHATMMGDVWIGILATGVHTLGYLVVTGLVAWVVYRKLGLALLRKAWINLDFIWAGALAATGVIALLV